VALMEKVSKAGAHFAAQGPKKAPAGGGGGRQDPPAGAPPCPGDGWEFKSGVSKNSGKAWKAWMPPKGSNEKPVFF